MEYSQEPGGADQQSGYWRAVLLVGGVFSLVAFITGLLFGYAQIASEPTGAVFPPFMFSSVVICLISCVAGLAAVWFYINYETPRLTLGQGAWIGFFTGAVIVLFSGLLNELWLIFDPSYTERLLESVVENVERMDLPEETKQQLADQAASSWREQNFFSQLFWGIPFTGLLNLLTGLLGVKLFADNSDNEERL